MATADQSQHHHCQNHVDHHSTALMYFAATLFCAQAVLSVRDTPKTGNKNEVPLTRLSLGLMRKHTHLTGFTTESTISGRQEVFRDRHNRRCKPLQRAPAFHAKHRALTGLEQTSFTQFPRSSQSADPDTRNTEHARGNDVRQRNPRTAPSNGDGALRKQQRA